MLYKFFQAQWSDECPGDWTNQVKKDLEDLDIDDTIEEIRGMSKNKFKIKIKKKIKSFTFQKLLEKKSQHSKMMKIQYNKFQIQNYMKSQDITTDDARVVFKFRTHMLNFSKNYGHLNEDKACPFCKNHEDDQDNMEECEYLKDKFKDTRHLKKIYEEEIPLDAISLLNRIMKCRKIKMDEEDNEGKQERHQLENFKKKHFGSFYCSVILEYIYIYI